MTISVSTYCCSSAMPASAARARFTPSKVKGLVTTPTVRMSRSRAMRAMTGAAPVPVPPPMPAVMNTMWTPSRWRSSSVGRFLGRGAADFRLGAGAEALGDVRPELDAPVGAAVHQLLRVGVGDDELHALQIQRDHVVDRVGAAAAHADDGDPRGEIGMRLLRNSQVQGHERSPWKNVPGSACPIGASWHDVKGTARGAGGAAARNRGSIRSAPSER